MLELNNGMILYHGSYCEVSNPQLSKCKNWKNFGKGFYLTSDKEQAKNFLKTAIKKASNEKIISADQPYGVISTFKVDLLHPLSCCIFQTADIDWLHCVVAHRKKDTFKGLAEKMQPYDVIAGKIADDATNITLNAYIAGVYGDVGSRKADTLCINNLLPEKLKNQFCFRTQQAIDCLKFIGGEIVCLEE